MQRQQNLASHVEENRTVIGAQTEVRGSVEGTGELRVHGSVEGNIQLRGMLSVQEGGLVRGDASATQIVVEGIVVGDLEAEVSIALRPTARVVGALSAPRLEVMEGAQFRGPIRTQSPAQSSSYASQQARAYDSAARSSKVAPRSSRKRPAVAPRSVAHDPETTVVVTHPEVKSASSEERSASPAVSAKLPARGKKRAQRRETGA